MNAARAVGPSSAGAGVRAGSGFPHLARLRAAPTGEPAVSCDM